MIHYDSKRICAIFRLNGSAMPGALVLSLPSVALTIACHSVRESYSEQLQFLDEINNSSVWSAVMMVLAIVLGARINRAYGRFWEGITLAQQMRAEWFETVSSLIAFSTVSIKKSPRDLKMRKKVLRFQFTLVRLMSLLHGAALRQIGGGLEEFEVIDVGSIDESSLSYLTACEECDINRVEVLLHWIQVLVTDSSQTGVLSVAPPILTRTYQTLSRGMVNLHNARKLADVPFPFPLSQFIVATILILAVLLPVYFIVVVEHVVFAAIVCFLPVFGMWTMTLIAGELEHPYGTDANDLPLSTLQFDFNMTLLMLLDDEANRPPNLSGTDATNSRVLWEKLEDHDSGSTTNSYQSKFQVELVLQSRAPKGRHQSWLAVRKQLVRSKSHSRSFSRNSTPACEDSADAASSLHSVVEGGKLLLAEDGLKEAGGLQDKESQMKRADSNLDWLFAEGTASYESGRAVDHPVGQLLETFKSSRAAAGLATDRLQAPKPLQYTKNSEHLVSGVMEQSGYVESHSSMVSPIQGHRIQEVPISDRLGRQVDEQPPAWQSGWRPDECQAGAVAPPDDTRAELSGPHECHVDEAPPESTPLSIKRVNPGALKDICLNKS